MKRREFIAFIGGAAIAWPRVVCAQQSDRMRRLGILRGAKSGLQRDVVGTAFQQEFQNLGWLDGSNVRIEYRLGGGAADRIQLFAKELVELQPDVIFAATTPAVAALLRETRSIPIVFVDVTDPVASGFVASLSRPQGNATGFTDHAPSLAGKWLEVLKEIAPGISRVALVFNPETAPGGGLLFLPSFEAAALSHGVKSIRAPVRNTGEIESIIAALGREPGGAFVAMSDISTLFHRGAMISLATQYNLPAIYPWRSIAVEGGLISYGIDERELWRRAATYVDRILRGAKPADLPVQQPTKFQLVINLKTAKALGLTVPPSLLALADEVIE